MKAVDRIIESKRSVIVAADVPDLASLSDLAKAIKGVNGIGGIKLGFSLGLRNLKTMVDLVKRILGPSFPVIYDHQKGGNDIPQTGIQFAKVLKESGVDAAILFPFAGPATQKAWTEELFKINGLQVLTGGIMTHPQFLVSEGGYIDDAAVEKIYRLACKSGVRHFVVPGNKIAWVKKIRAWLVEELGEGNFVLYAPGFIEQKGVISECGQAAGDEWHAIVGTAIYGQENQRQAAILVTSQIVT